MAVEMSGAAARNGVNSERSVAKLGLEKVTIIGVLASENEAANGGDGGGGDGDGGGGGDGGDGGGGGDGGAVAD